MKRSIISITIGLFLLLTGCARNETKMTTIYDFKALNNKGEEVDMAQYKGKVLMIVNTASLTSTAKIPNFSYCLIISHIQEGGKIIG